MPKAEYVPTIIRRDDPSIIPILYVSISLPLCKYITSAMSGCVGAGFVQRIIIFFFFLFFLSLSLVSVMMILKSYQKMAGSVLNADLGSGVALWGLESRWKNKME